MSYRLAINGFGRIGRCILRALHESGHRAALQVVAINEPCDVQTLVHLTRYDSSHGRFPGEVDYRDGLLWINGDPIQLSHTEKADQAPWAGQHIDLVLECSGSFSSRAVAEQHLATGARRLLFSQPAETDVDATVVFGVNDAQLSAEMHILSNGSCTSNAIVPVIDCLDKAFGIEAGTVTTIHSAMSDQPVTDAYHHTDLRKTRAAGHSIIPVDTELARGIGRILPHLGECFSAQAFRVPTLNVSAMDLSVVVKQPTSVSAVNRVLQQATGGYQGVLGYTEEPLASCDFNHDPRSGIIDAGQTRVSAGRLVKVVVWFDNEWGFANRMLDVAAVLSRF